MTLGCFCSASRNQLCVRGGLPAKILLAAVAAPPPRHPDKLPHPELHCVRFCIDRIIDFQSRTSLVLTSFGSSSFFSQLHGGGHPALFHHRPLQLLLPLLLELLRQSDRHGRRQPPHLSVGQPLRPARRSALLRHRHLSAVAAAAGL